MHHKDAIKRAAQLKYDLQLEGVVIVYSWPSKGTLWDYRHDEEMVQRTARCLQSFIQTILSEVMHGLPAASTATWTLEVAFYCLFLVSAMAKMSSSSSIPPKDGLSI